MAAAAALTAWALSRFRFAQRLRCAAATLALPSVVIPRRLEAKSDGLKLTAEPVALPLGRHASADSVLRSPGGLAPKSGGLFRKKGLQQSHHASYQSQ